MSIQELFLLLSGTETNNGGADNVISFDNDSNMKQLTYASEARSRSMYPPAASIPACQSMIFARPLLTRCSATLPLGCITIPMNMLAGGGGPDWVEPKGSAAGVGSERSLTRTSRCSRRLSVKNLA